MSPAVFPLDVLLEVTRDLDLPDSLHLSATCTGYSAILLSPSFWIATLKRVEQVHRRTLPCSPGTDISALPLVRLRALAIHAYKLRKNWTSDSPHPVSIHSFHLKEDPAHTIPIQGTHLLIIISRDHVACWDTTSDECLATFEHGATVNWKPSVLPFLAPGMCSVGMVGLSSLSDVELCIICVDHRDPAAVKISKVFSKTWDSPNPHATLFLFDVVVSQDIVGAMFMGRSDRVTFLLFSNTRKGDIHRVSLGSNYNVSIPQCAIVENGFFITNNHWEPLVTLTHILSSSAPPRSAIDTIQIDKTTRSVPFPITEQTEPHALHAGTVRNPKYGVLKLIQRTSYIRREDETAEFHGIYFWPAEYDGSTLRTDPLCVYEHSSEVMRDAVGLSAACGIIVDQNNAFGLVQYFSRPTPHVEFRAIDIPAIDVKTIRNIALDDGLGVLYIAEREETGSYCLTVVSYA
ncbi:hypothetical protein B0H11DRAFT_2069212 [Mycena galericulata]|nr:hypothetical protein B0H11DRAFT_2069212 [Mycena galericulata]